MSPLLFNVYSEDIFKQALRVENGIKVGETRVSNIRYTDDTVLISDSVDGFQSILSKVNAVSCEYGLEMNVLKTKSMIIH